MSWPTWLQKTLPDWLEKTGYPCNGVGDLEDLFFKTKTTQTDKWLGFVTPGWFYYENQENYKYIEQGTQTLTTATSGTITAVTSYRPSWGPVLLTGSLYGPYVQHHNIYEPGIQETWTQVVSTQIFYCDLASNQYLVGLRDLNNTKFGRVSSLSYPLTESLYYYDETLNRVYVLSPVTAPTNKIFLDVLYDAPVLKFKEVLTVDKDNKVRLSYSRPYGMNSIVLKRGITQITPSSGYPAVVNEFDTTALGTKEGDWVVAEYFINNSFIITAHNSISYYSNTLGAETLTVNFETSVPTTNKPFFVTNSITGGELNLNPTLEDGFRSGYLFYTDVAPAWTTKSIDVEADREFFNTPETRVKVKITLRDTNGLPIPNKTITTLNLNSATVVARYPATNKTDNKGELNLLLTRSSSITVSVTDNSITKSKTITYLTLSSALSQINTSTVKKAFPIFCEEILDDQKYIYFTTVAIDGRPSATPTIFTPATPMAYKLNNTYSQTESTVTPTLTSSNPLGYQKVTTTNDFNFLIKTGITQSTLGGN